MNHYPIVRAIDVGIRKIPETINRAGYKEFIHNAGCLLQLAEYPTLH